MIIFFHLFICVFTLQLSMPHAAGNFDKNNEKLENQVYQDNSSSPRVLILHPIYAGSHELVLRTFAEILMIREGGSVTQVRWKYHGMRKVRSSVEVVDLHVNNSELK